MDKITSQTKVTTAITPTAGVAATTDITGAIIDMAGYDGVKMQVRFGAITSGAVTTMKIQQGNDSGLSDAADVAGSLITVADTDDDKIFGYDITQPGKRYLRVYVDRGTQNAVVADGHYEQYRKRTVPVSAQGTGVTFLQLNAPAEGTP